ncbi:hypothetical protein EPN83_00355 [Patescibacteria group bacterium]|nr:MAG: hypothetical protein EPN83_00355 [Patescibacteria group bacterium]
MNVSKLQIGILCAAATALAPLLAAQADTALITNTVSTSANTGGGSAASRVQIKTTIDGEVVENIDEEISLPGPNVIEKIFERGNVRSSIRLEVSGSKESQAFGASPAATSAPAKSLFPEKVRPPFFLLPSTAKATSNPALTPKRVPLGSFIENILRYVFSIFPF